MNPNIKRILIHSILFILALGTTTLVGAQFTSVDPENLNWETGLVYSFSFLGILTFHEFGHYFMAKYYKVKSSLPYYIPMYIPLPGFLNPIGTFGAVIRIKDLISSRKHFFDIGVAGPIAGFIVALGVLFYGFTHLPPLDYIYSFHPDYAKYGADYASHVFNKDVIGENVLLLGVGDNLLFWLFKNYVAPNPELVPHSFEMMHYPLLYSGYLAAFFTALNLLPIGQLDGGHTIYGLFGAKKHAVISRVVLIGFIFYAGLGMVNPYSMMEDSWIVVLYIAYLFFTFRKVFSDKKNVYLTVTAIFTVQFMLTFLFPSIQGYSGWLLFGFLLGSILKVDHPITPDERPLDFKRKIVGYFCILIFILCFSPQPFIMEL